MAVASFQSSLELVSCMDSSLFPGRQGDRHPAFDKVPMTMPLVSPQNVMFYDMGSGSTVCTIVTYQTVKTKEAGMQPQLQIRGVGYVTDTSRVLSSWVSGAFFLIPEGTHFLNTASVTLGGSESGREKETVQSLKSRELLNVF